MAEAFVRLRVGGEGLEVARELLEREDSLLRSLVSQRWRPRPGRAPPPALRLDVDGKTFRYVLHYLRHGEIPNGLPSWEVDMLRKQAKYLQLSSLYWKMRLLKAQEGMLQTSTLVDSLKVSDMLYRVGLHDEAWAQHARAWQELRGDATYRTYCAYYEEKSQKDPCCPWRLFMHATAASADGADVASLAGRLEGLAPGSAMSLCLRAVALAQGGDHPSAADRCHQALSLRPDFAEALCTLSYCEEEPAKAIEWSDQALRLRPNDGSAHHRRGEALLHQGLLAEALAACDETVRLRPSWPDAHRMRGEVLRRQHRLAAALAAYDEAVRLSPGDFRAHLCRGQVLGRQGFLCAALAAVEQAERLQAASAAEHRGRGAALQPCGLTPDPLATLDAAVCSSLFSWGEGVRRQRSRRTAAAGSLARGR